MARPRKRAFQGSLRAQCLQRLLPRVGRCFSAIGELSSARPAWQRSKISSSTRSRRPRGGQLEHRVGGAWRISGDMYVPTIAETTGGIMDGTMDLSSGIKLGPVVFLSKEVPQAAVTQFTCEVVATHIAMRSSAIRPSLSAPRPAGASGDCFGGSQASDLGSAASVALILRDGKWTDDEGVQELADSVIALFPRRDVLESVKFSVLHTTVNGWCTNRRFQQVVADGRLGCAMALLRRLGLPGDRGCRLALRMESTLVSHNRVRHAQGGDCPESYVARLKQGARRFPAVELALRQCASDRVTAAAAVAR